MTPAGTSNELDVQNGWEENTHTHTHSIYVGISFSHDSHHAWDIPVYSFGYNFSINEFQVAPVAQRYHVTSDTLGREFDPGKRNFSH